MTTTINLFVLQITKGIPVFPPAAGKGWRLVYMGKRVVALPEKRVKEVSHKGFVSPKVFKSKEDAEDYAARLARRHKKKKKDA